MNPLKELRITCAEDPVCWLSTRHISPPFRDRQTLYIRTIGGALGMGPAVSLSPKDARKLHRLLSVYVNSLPRRTKKGGVR